MESFSYKELAEAFTNNNDIGDIFSVIKSRISYDLLTAESQNSINEQIFNFVRNLKRRYKDCDQSKQKLYQRCKQWLERDLVIEFQVKPPDKNEGSIGRPSKLFEEEMSERNKRRKLNKLNADFGSENIKDAFLHQLKSDRKYKKAKIVQHVISATPSRTTRILNSIPTPKEEKKFTPEEALGLFLDLKLTKHQYYQLRQRALQKNVDLFPAYGDILSAKKECYPPNDAIKITEKSAEVELQSLLDHTSERLLQSLEMNDFKRYGNCHLTLYCKWGCDGSSGQQIYKQTIDEDVSDSDLFMVSLVPLRLKKNIEDMEPSTSRTQEEDIWINKTPASTKFCRPIKFEFKKETKETIKGEVDAVREQIKSLQPNQIVINGQTVIINYKLMLTMIDGKVAQVLTDTKATSSCIICNATRSKLNEDLPPSTLLYNTDAYEFGLSPLHARIRFMENILKISYDLEFGSSASVRNSEENKEKRKLKKRQVQDEFRKLGLIIDQPKPGQGNTNDGNTARRFFLNPEEVAAITGVDKNLIFRFRVILEVINCHDEINPEKFGVYAKETAELYKSIYPWRSMPTTVHKVLYHGKDVIQNNVLPMGDLSEEAQEKRNKDYRYFREHNTRKMNRKCTNEDLLNILLATSDPLLSSRRHQWKSIHLELSVEAKRLLMKEEYLDEIFQPL